jgi:hypothetical protein
MRTFIISALTLCVGLVVGYGVVLLVIALAKLVWWLLMALVSLAGVFMVVCVIMLPFTFLIWAIRSLIREVVR